MLEAAPITNDFVNVISSFFENILGKTVVYISEVLKWNLFFYDELFFFCVVCKIFKIR
jgi:hypothetical protein